jgi:hypothetical protein
LGVCQQKRNQVVPLPPVADIAQVTVILIPPVKMVIDGKRAAAGTGNHGLRSLMVA